jgi:hypothetical protein
MLESAVFATVADAVFGYALDHSGVAEKLRSKPGDQARRLAFQTGLANAYLRFRREHSDAVRQFFDGRFLQGRAVPLLSRFVIGGPEPTGHELAVAYAEQFWSNPAHSERVPQITPAAEGFLRILKAALRESEELRPLVDGVTLDQLARSSGESAAALSRIEHMHAELLRVASEIRAALSGTGQDLFVEDAPDTSAGDAAEPDSRPVFMTPRLPLQGIIGREDMLETVLERLSLEAGQRDLAPVVLQGMGGIGKTTLAVAIGRLQPVVGYFNGGVFWTSLGPKPNCRTQLQGWGDQLGLDLRPERDLAGCKERLRYALEKQRALLLVDDIWELEHAKHFDLAGPEGRIVFTTRETRIAYPLVGKEHVVRVGVLGPDASLALLRRLAPDAVAAKRDDAVRLCERLEFLPLALTLAGRLLAIESDVPERLETVLRELIERRDEALQLLQEEGRFGASDEPPVTVEAILAMSVDRLDALDHERFARSYVFAGDPLDWPLTHAAATWECTPEEAAATTSRFIQRGLVERRGERYWMHALLADYARVLYNRMHPEAANFAGRNS